MFTARSPAGGENGDDGEQNRVQPIFNRSSLHSRLISLPYKRERARGLVAERGGSRRSSDGESRFSASASGLGILSSPLENAWSAITCIVTIRRHSDLYSTPGRCRWRQKRSYGNSQSYLPFALSPKHNRNELYLKARRTSLLLACPIVLRSVWSFN